MARTKQDLDYTNIDVSSLSEEHRVAFQAYKDAYNYAKELKATFEAGMRRDAGLPQGQMLFFGYNFGKLALAIGIDDTTPKAAAKSQPTLAAFLASQQASGHNA